MVMIDIERTRREFSQFFKDDKRMAEVCDSLICMVPAVDAVPVVHGKWINPHFRNSYYCCNCSACSGEAMHMEFRWHKKGIYRICPNCGADMREAEHETN